jgi:Ribbon-helix-helix protein, copG family
MEAKDDNMIRTQISLDKRDYALAKKEAAALGISVAELMRRALRAALPTTEESRWMRYAGFVETGNSRSSRYIDEIVYGSKD